MRKAIKKSVLLPQSFLNMILPRQIAGDKADISMLLSPGSESHSFEPTPQDIIKIQNCDLFIYVGGENDEWVRSILDSVDQSKMKTIALLDCVDVVEEQVKEGMEAEHEHEGDAEHEHEGDAEHEHEGDAEHEHEGDAEHEHEGSVEYDEHVWTSPENCSNNNQYNL